jgi:hypothetical protein
MTPHERNQIMDNVQEARNRVQGMGESDGEIAAVVAIGLLADAIEKLVKSDDDAEWDAKLAQEKERLEKEEGEI